MAREPPAELSRPSDGAQSEYLNDTDQDKSMENTGHDQQQMNDQASQSHQTKGKGVQTGESTRKNGIPTDNTNTEAHIHKDTNQQGGTSKVQQHNNRANREYQNNFPRISNNYARYDLNLQKNRNVDNQGNNKIAQGNVKHPNSQQQGQAQNNAKQDTIPEPAPFTIVQSFATRLRYNQSKNETLIVLDSPIHTTRQGLPAVLLEEEDYNIKLVLYLDSPSSQKTRGNMARVKIQIDLTKKRPSHVWVGFKNSDPNKGRWQKIQYKGIPDYYMYCKHQGHVDNVCTIKKRDEDFKKRKEMEAEKKNKNKGEQEKGGTKTIQLQDNVNPETNTDS
ncbi:hypothetical protein H5410_027379 [Solanum commersonii]|uniref:DUF4283 domain-containing protein n=1 Tax=Solanum commersonii TaxID=4109 RepID=A0A9J5Z1U4_SOLCO|nr:hypothetical protein H5410_027379 [Solanum commersonii]